MCVYIFIYTHIFSGLYGLYGFYTGSTRVLYGLCRCVVMRISFWKNPTTASPYHVPLSDTCCERKTGLQEGYSWHESAAILP